MSSRETAINVFVGALLLLAFAVPVIACVAALGLVFYSLNAAAHHFLPALAAAKDIAFFVVLCLVSAVAGVRCLRKRLWPNALLSFAVISLPLASWSGAFWFGANWHGSARPFGLPWSLTWPMLLLFTIPADRGLRRWEIVLLGTLLGAGIVLNTALLGQGTSASVVADGFYLAAFAWMSIQFRRGEFGRLSPNVLSQTNS